MSKNGWPRLCACSIILPLVAAADCCKLIGIATSALGCSDVLELNGKSPRPDIIDGRLLNKLGVASDMIGVARGSLCWLAVTTFGYCVMLVVGLVCTIPCTTTCSLKTILLSLKL